MGIYGLETFLFNTYYEPFFEFTDEFIDEISDEFTDEFGEEFSLELNNNNNNIENEVNDEFIEDSYDDDFTDESSYEYEEEIYEPNDLSLAVTPNESKSPFVLRELKDLNLVIDGNQFPYHISHMLKSNEYGGNYDQIYDKIREIFQILKPFIEIVIFDGSKEDLNKSIFRFNKNIDNSIRVNSSHDIDDLKKTPPFFFRMIMYKVLRELKIKHVMTDGMADHAVACYANGFNDKGVYGTVLSMDSHFYAYNLKNGYLSFKYFNRLLYDLTNLNGSTEVPVFYVGRLIKILELRNFRTWLYFCILLGDYDINLISNKRFMNAHCLKDKKDLLDHLKKEESSLLQNGYKHIRNDYNHNNYLIKLIDGLIQCFEFKNSKYKIEYSDKFDDFNRIILTMRDINTIFLYSIIEDTNQNHVYQICQYHHILEQIYKLISRRVITEYSRSHNSHSNRSVRVVQYSDKRIKSNHILDYIDRAETVAKEIDVDDSQKMNLFSISLSVWYDWICKINIGQKKFKTDNISFIDAIFHNFLILRIKQIIINDDNHCIQTGQDYYGDLLRKGLRRNLNDYVRIVELYDNIADPSKNSKSKFEFFEKDLSYVHCINEFQSLYYMIGVYCRIKSINKLKWLSPDEFLNGLFICKYLQEFETNGTESNALYNLMERNQPVINALDDLIAEFNECLENIPFLLYSKGYDLDY
jgi:hypothetical protein